jgi:hypothetical protein
MIPEDYYNTERDLSEYDWSKKSFGWGEVIFYIIMAVAIVVEFIYLTVSSVIVR